MPAVKEYPFISRFYVLALVIASLNGLYMAYLIVKLWSMSDYAFMYIGIPMQILLPESMGRSLIRPTLSLLMILYAVAFWICAMAIAEVFLAISRIAQGQQQAPRGLAYAGSTGSPGTPAGQAVKYQHTTFRAEKESTVTVEKKALDPAEAEFESRRIVACMRITKQGYHIETSGAYPNVKWTIMQGGKRFKIFTKLDDLVTFGESFRLNRGESN